MLRCIKVCRRNADTESAKTCRIEWVLANFVPFKVCRFLSASAHGPAQECGGVAVFSGKGLPLYRALLCFTALYCAVAGRCRAEDVCDADTDVGYPRAWLVVKWPALWVRQPADAPGVREGWLQRIVVPAALAPEGSGAAYGPSGTPRFATILGARIAA